MSVSIPVPQRINNKVQGDFYPLQKEELIALKKAKIINNTAYVHLALRFENPYCDRPIEVIPKEFALRWGIPESSVYEAIGKLKELGILKIKTGKIVVQWNNSQEAEPIDSQQDLRSGNPEFLRDPRTDSENPELITRSQNELRDPRMDSENLENQTSEPLCSNSFSSPQTLHIIQTLQTLQTEGGEDEKNDGENLVNGIDDANDIKGNGLVRKNCHNPPISRTEKISSREIPQDLMNKLEELEIPLDPVVKKAIASHDLSQAWGAVRHIENTRETVKNPRSVFLYQIPKQTIDKSKPKPLPLEFLDWYQYARGEKVVDVPPEQLIRDQFGEPMLRLKSDPYRLVNWQRVRDDAGLEQVATPEQVKQFMEKIRAIAAKGGKGNGSST